MSFGLRESKMKYPIGILFMIVMFSLLLKTSMRHDVFLSNEWLPQNENGNRIPSIVHFVVGQIDRENGENRYGKTSPFSFMNYIIFLAARRHLRPEKLYAHYYQEPDSFWWNQTKNDPEIDVTLVKNRLVEKIFNNTVNHHSHRSDVIRLEVIMKYGGIYLDIDVLTLRPFDPLLNLNDVVLAHQDDNKDLACTAVILAKKGATFIRRIYDAYQSFNPNCWDCHAVSLPGKLASIYPHEVTVLPTETFFRPSWNETNKLFELNDYNFTPNYASHLWNKASTRHLSELTPDLALNSNTTFGRMLRQAIDNSTFLNLRQIFIKNLQH